MVISSIFCHYITGNCGRRAEHNEDRHEFLIAVAEIDGKGKEKSRQKNQFNKRSDDGGFYFFDGLSSLETGSDGDERQRGGSGADTADGLIQECRKPEPGKDKEQGDDDTEENWIFEYIQYRFLHIMGRVILPFQSQDQHSKNIIERNGADDHQGSHACAVIHVINKSKTQDGGAAAVRCLNKGTFLGIIFHKKLCQPPDHQNDEKGGEKTEQYIAPVKTAFDIIFCQILENKGGKGCHKDIFIRYFSKMVIDDM